ncbi:MAG: hypothetical protein JSR18_16005 [Proteobacteria bacterium]|nr:hypothetical protein [Pseudomonadota bacterium]
MANEPRTGDAQMDVNALYREEIYTDRRIGTLRVLVPVTPQGTPDEARETVYQGEAQLMTNAGPLPIAFEIEATNLADAVAGYGKAAQEGVERTMKELQQLRRESQSSIVIPESSALPPAGGKIQLR